ncbi:MAG: FAD-binding oxidoreductase [Betaproteobacteria bacterium]|nr:MAG: FAD-binding oxidoreductase [Betaproteobacteria bacterium]
MQGFVERKAKLIADAKANDEPVGIAKHTSSNLFRYAPADRRGTGLDLSDFHHCLSLDAQARTLDVEGLTTFEQIVDYTLPYGLVPRITPELKHITIGGATVGIGIESNCFRYGFVHDGLIEAEVLMPDGRVVLASANNEYADLFYGLPNSYGTLGYILRARIHLMPAQPYVHLATRRFHDVDAFLDAMRAATESDEIDFVEGLFLDKDRLYVTCSRFCASVPRVDDIVREHVFYKLLLARPDVYLTTKDYLFRYDPEWFWNLPESWPYDLFRRYAPARFRNSGFYKRYTTRKNALRRRLGLRDGSDEEPLIQDWELPWDEAAAFTRFALREVDLSGRPWIATPIRTPRSPPLYPVRENTLYYNLGCYCYVRKPGNKPPYWYTRILDDECFARGGLKMLYSSTFLSREKFDRIYNGPAYAALKARYDPNGVFGDLYSKAVLEP